MATTIQKTQINNLNTTVYTIATKSKQQTSVPTALQSAGGNAVNGKAQIVNINNLKTAINALETKFSNNCCQAQCNVSTSVYAGTVKTGTKTNTNLRTSSIKYYNYYNYGNYNNYYNYYDYSASF